MVKYMQGTSIYASSFALILLSFDRAEVVINPMRSTKKVCFGAMHRKMLVFCSWAAAGIFGLPSPILAQIVNQTCVYDFTRVTPKAYIVSVSVTAFFLPALFIAVCHVIMVVRIWQAGVTDDKDSIVQVNKPASKFRRVVTHIFHDSQTQQSNINSETKSISQSSKFIPLSSSPGCIPRARIKTVKMTLVIVSVYIICCCPFVIYNILTTYEIIGRHTPKLYAISPLIQPLASINSSVNPLIFWIFSAHTIITERRKNRQSKVVQRQHRRWKYRDRNRICQSREERSEENMILKARSNEYRYPNNRNRIITNDKKRNVGVIHSENTPPPSSDTITLKRSEENSYMDKEEITPIKNTSYSSKGS
nr:Peptide G protein-coupled receptor Partial [Hymenolepis microstoma]